MKLAYYLGNFTPENGGAFTYATALINVAKKTDRISKIYIIHGKDNYDHLKSLSEDSDKIFFIKDPVLDNKIWKGIYFLCFGLFVLNEFVHSTFVCKVIRWITRINPYNRFFNSLPADLIHVPYCYMPVLKCKKKFVISFHDLQDLRFPDFFTAKERLYRAFLYKFSLEKSDHIIVSFGHIKEDIHHYFQIPYTKTSLCLLPFHLKFIAPPDKNTPTVHDTLEKFQIDENFLLYPANTWPHKNHIMLIQAINQLKRKGVFIKLICTGKRTSHYEKILLLIESLGLQAQVKFTGLIADYDLMNLYQAARLVVIPSLYEAGSAPLFEAIRFLTPVVCSNVTSLPETMNASEFVFNPLNLAEMTEKIQSGITDETFRERNINNLKQRLQFFNSLDYSSNFYSVYQLLSQPNS